MGVKRRRRTFTAEYKEEAVKRHHAITVDIDQTALNDQKWAKGEVMFEDGILDGTRKDFDEVCKAIAKERGLPNKSAAQKLLKEAGLTPHHVDANRINSDCNRVTLRFCKVEADRSNSK